MFGHVANNAYFCAVIALTSHYEKYNLHTDASGDGPAAASGGIPAAASGDGPANRHGAE